MRPLDLVRDDEVVNQFSRGAPLITSPDEREQAAELNLAAGKRAEAPSAYASARSTIVEGAELRGFSAQGPGERDRRGKSVEEEPVPLNELQCILGFALELVEWMAQCKKNSAETARGECGICRVAVPFCHLEGTTRRFDALS